MPESELTPLVGAEGEEPAGVGDDRGVLVPAGQLLDEVALDPELGGRVLRELGAAEREDGARGGHLRLDRGRWVRRLPGGVALLPGHFGII